MAEMFEIDGAQRQFHEIIKVVGVGGGGGNALNHIVRSGVRGVEFIAANTDIAHLSLSEADLKIVLGRELTKGLGAGADPEIGLRAAEESIDELREVLNGADMIFLTAGMGGGTGTGASPVIAEAAKETDALVVAVATRPFSFEGKRRIAQAEEGIARLKEKVDALIIIPNDKLLEITDRRTTLSDAFKLADEVLRQAVQGVTDLILRPGMVNVDFADVRTVMQNSGTAIMGIGEGDGDDRAIIAAQAAINSPLMDSPIGGAQGILFNVTGGPNLGIHEIQEAANVITEAADPEATIIWGHVIDSDMDEDKIQITVIATGFPTDGISKRARRRKNGTPIRLELTETDVRVAGEEQVLNLIELPEDDIDIPSVLRRRKNQQG
ncbi:MAG: cell division protein FtsZ [Thermovirgaceae bacterium]